MGAQTPLIFIPIWEDRHAKFENADHAYKTSYGDQKEEPLSEKQRALLAKVVRLQERVRDAKAKEKRAQLKLRNEKQRQRNKRIRENLERYKNEQRVIDLEQQLQGKLVDKKVMGAIEKAEVSSPEFMMVIETVLTMPGTTIEAEYQRRINAIKAMTAFCGVEEGRPTSRAVKSLRRAASDEDLVSSQQSDKIFQRKMRLRLVSV